PGTPASSTLDPANETDLYRFDAAAGDRVFFDTQARSGAGNARWRLLDPFGNTFFEAAFNSPSSDVGPVTLGTAGTYTLLIEGRVFDSGTGSYTFRVAPVIDAPPVALNAAAPTVVITLQPASDLGASNTDHITADDTPTFDVTVNQAGTVGVDF